MSVDAPADTGEIDLDTFSEEFFTGKAPEPKQEVEEVVQDEDSIVEPEEVEVETEAETNEPEENAEAEKPKKKRDVQERMNELTRQRYEAERRELEAQRELQKLRDEIARGAAAPAKTENPVEDTAPDPETKLENGEAKYPLGEFDPAYIRDLARHTIKQEQEAAAAYRKEAEAKAAEEQTRAQAQAKFAEKLQAAEAETPDIQNKIMSLDPMFNTIEPRYGQYLLDVVRQLDNAPQVLAYLADNPASAQQIVNAGAAAATVALGRLDAQLTKPTKEQKKVTKAPEPPVRTRGTQGQFAVAGDTDDLDSFSRVFFSKK